MYLRTVVEGFGRGVKLDRFALVEHLGFVSSDHVVDRELPRTMLPVVLAHVKPLGSELSRRKLSEASQDVVREF